MRRLRSTNEFPARKRRDIGHYNSPSRKRSRKQPEEAALLYFAYTARIAPEKLMEVAPGAQFEFIAHLPEWGIEFPIDGNGWNGSLPSVLPTEGSTVWGAVFSIPDDEIESLNDIEREEARTVSTVEAMDRTGKRHQVLVHVYDGAANGALVPSADYLELMLQGSRHWSLPAGWIAGLEEQLEASRS